MKVIVNWPPSLPTVLVRTLAATHMWGFVICILFRHSVGLLWTSDQPVTKACTYVWQCKTDRWGKHTCHKRDANPRSQRPSDQGLRLRPRGHWDLPYRTYTNCITYFGLTVHTYSNISYILKTYHSLRVSYDLSERYGQFQTGCREPASFLYNGS
jgi:hypothetical protein